jgi:hypothetical protein
MEYEIRRTYTHKNVGVVPPCLPRQESNYGEFPLQKDCGFPRLGWV